jgi:hypothetical protein
MARPTLHQVLFTGLIVILAVVCPAKELSNTQAAGCLLSINIDPDIMTGADLESLFFSSGVAGRAGKEILGVPLEVSREFIQISENKAIHITLPESDEIPPAAEEFLNALLGYTKEEVHKLYALKVRQLKEQLGQARGDREKLYNEYKTQFASSTGASDLDKQLNTMVDLSAITRRTNFGDAIEILHNSVDPHLPLIVLWNTLEFGPEPNTPVGMNGIKSIRVNTALELLLKAVSDDLGDPVLYQIQDNTIVISSSDFIEQQWQLEKNMENLSLNDLYNKQRDLLNEQQDMQRSLAEREAEQRVIDEQIALITHQVAKQVADDPVIKELKQLVDLHEKRVEDFRTMYTSGNKHEDRAELEALQENLLNAKIELAKQERTAAQDAQGNILADLNNRLYDITTELAMGHAELDVINKQLHAISEQQAKLKLDQQNDALGLREHNTMQQLKNIERRIADLEEKLRNLEEPAIFVIGGPER